MPTPLSGWDVFWWAALGAMMAEFVVILPYRHTDLPHWIKTWTYWTIVFGMAGLGGGVAAAYQISGTLLNPILAIQVGATAPLIIRQLGGHAAKGEGAPDMTKID